MGNRTNDLLYYCHWERTESLVVFKAATLSNLSEICKRDLQLACSLL